MSSPFELTDADYRAAIDRARTDGYVVKGRGAVAYHIDDHEADELVPECGDHDGTEWTRHERLLENDDEHFRTRLCDRCVAYLCGEYRRMAGERASNTQAEILRQCGYEQTDGGEWVIVDE